MWIRLSLLPLLLPCGALPCLGQASEEPEQAAVPQIYGPFLGHATEHSALLWGRTSQAGEYTLRVDRGAELAALEVSARATPEQNLTLNWQVEGLAADTSYKYQVFDGSGARESAGQLRTAPADDAALVRLAFGSCAHEGRFPQQASWSRILEEGAEALVLLGDMPYIDSTELAVQRRRYGEFYALPEIALALGSMPTYATWDDHDFGLNDTNGLLPGKENSRRAFIENHANPSYGQAGFGIYTKFRRGPIEVFLLDARSFAGTAASPIDPELPTLLGAAQWSWLRQELAASTATFKVLATGMIWNGATRPGKTDHWAAYPHERQAVFDMIGELRVSGVVLIGGDIHRSRALRYPTTASAGYELTELITSPLANTVIEAANAPSPFLLHDVGQQEAFLMLDADTSVTPATLVGRCMNAAGELLFQVDLDLSQLTAVE